ncbi:DUF4365 domain-containing protein [Bacillus subtilis]|nr:DUF4365 domain-containing protein [Bacillus subtilis]MED4875840.1 DUF4365 domain-containing protein [Bacillus subtilis]QAT57979.1 DUF4365 domain-containing protein [Bacillus subtilis]QHM05584.1 hypothetical protein C7M27_01521 [Bacillus subtilis]CAF1812269.1 hypothetical protein NRS6148_00999 [Bacillus subtilis]
MPNMNWSKLNNLQLGRYGEYYAMMDFASYGYQIFSSEVDDHGIDFIARKAGGEFLEIQVKSLSFPKTTYTFLKEKHFNPHKKGFYIYLMLFIEGSLPQSFLIPGSVFLEENDPVFKYRPNYKEPEYGINVSKKNMHILEQYSLSKLESEISV